MIIKYTPAEFKKVISLYEREAQKVVFTCHIKNNVSIIKYLPIWIPACIIHDHITNKSINKDDLLETSDMIISRFFQFINSDALFIKDDALNIYNKSHIEWIGHGITNCKISPSEFKTPYSITEYSIDDQYKKQYSQSYR